MSEKRSKGHFTKEEVTLKDVWQFLWLKRKSILIFSFAGAVLGVMVAFTAPKEWSSKSELLPQTKEETGLGSLSGLAGLAGFSVGSLTSANGINPELYGNIVNSTPFLKELMYKEFYFERLGDSVSLYDYFTRYRMNGLTGRVFSIFGSAECEVDGNTPKGGFLYFNSCENGVAKELNERIGISVDQRYGYVIISSTMQDAVVSGQVVQFTKDYLVQFISDFYRAKELRKLEFVASQLEEKKREYEAHETILSEFLDKNISLSRETAQNKKRKLQNDNDRLFNVYNTLAQQYEEAKIKVEESTPVFVELEPIKVPYLRTSPKRKVIVIVYGFFGLITVLVFLFSKEILKSIK